ncbi:hypothetical protein GOV14_06450 [Candidatus Pacearchaeota archaeon]|nr:hypothetical protein [Candidatus Pacearchaeota archaeon]
MIFGGFGISDSEGRKKLCKDKGNLLNAIAEHVKEQSTRKKLSDKDPFVQYLIECSAREKLLFGKALKDYGNYMEYCTARIEARLVRNALEDFDKGDYQSSRIKPYQRFLIDIIEGKDPQIK